MDPLTLRVASIFVVRLADEGEEGPSGKGGVPARWHEWLDAVHQGGKKQVPNPNPDTRARFPQVTFSTSLKDKATFSKALKEYHEWAKKNPEKDKPSEKAPAKTDESKDKSRSEDDSKDKSKSEGASKAGGAFHKAFDVTPEDLDRVLKEHGKKFDDIIAKGKNRLDTYHYNKGASADREWNGLSETEKIIHVIGHKLGAVFESTLSKADRALHKEFYEQWRDSTDTNKAVEMMGAVTGLGIAGTANPDWTPPKKQKYEEGKKNDTLKEYAKKAYVFQQALFKHMGSKLPVQQLKALAQKIERHLEASPDHGGTARYHARDLSQMLSNIQVVIDELRASG